MSSPETKTHILVVEDEGIVAKDIQAMLRGLGYHVPKTVGTGEMAVQIAREAKPDLILMDIQLRGQMDGVEAAGLITAQQDIAVVFLTANSDEATLQRAKLTDPFGFLIKPFEERSLQAGIETALYKHRTERRMREREQWLSTTLSSIADAIITTDSDGSITYLNQAAVALTGWAADEAGGRLYSEVFQIMDEVTRAAPPDRVAESLATGATCNFSHHTLLRTLMGEERHIQHSVAPIRQGLQEQVGGCVIVFSDVTEKKQLEERLRQAQKLDAIGKLAGGIAHDFNNAITAIMGYAQMILSRPDQSQASFREARQIVRAAEHSARLTHQLLAFSRKQVLRPRALNLAQECEEVEGMVRRLVGENITLETRVAEDLWSTMADPGQIHQVVLNLAINARDAMPQGGRLCFEMANAAVTEAEARHLQEGRAGEFVRLQVRDTGTGMPPDVMNRIFEPFFTTKGQGKGTGLGLATCYGIIKQSAGMIGVASELGVGTTFSVYLPKSEAVREDRELRANEEEMRGGTETILFVEDEEILRELGVEVLQGLGYRVIAAEDGCAALELLHANQASPVDLVVTDLVMPRLSGRELVAALAERDQSMRVLLMSGYTDDDIIRSAIQGSEVSYLQKPFTPRLLARKVREMLDSHGAQIQAAA